MKVIVNTSSFSVQDSRPIELLRAKGIEPVMNPYKRLMTAEEVVHLCSDADAIIAGTEPLTADVLAKLLCLKVISRCGSGMDNVDLYIAQKRGIRVFNTPSGPTIAVAELALGLMLTMLRRTHEMDHKLHIGLWEKKMGNLLSGKIVGIVGFGRIGQKLAQLLVPFNVRIVYNDINKVQGVVNAERLSLSQLLMCADIVCIHAASESDTQLISANAIAQMKKGSWLMNLARGGLVDEESLAAALRSGHLSGAAFDVFSQEPYSGPLTLIDNVILTPHVGSYAAEARVLMEIESVENLLQGLRLL
jgi:D-3-phosphoglycerate dehydrogenase / 2-oxoglutarate reductase